MSYKNIGKKHIKNDDFISKKDSQESGINSVTFIKGEIEKNSILDEVQSQKDKKYIITKISENQDSKYKIESSKSENKSHSGKSEKENGISTKLEAHQNETKKYEKSNDKILPCKPVYNSLSDKIEKGESNLCTLEANKKDIKKIGYSYQRNEDLIQILKNEFKKKSDNIILSDNKIEGEHSIIFVGKKNDKIYSVKNIIYNYFKTGDLNIDKIKEKKLKEIAQNEVLLTYNIRYKYCIKMMGYYTFPNATSLILEYATGKDLNCLIEQFYEGNYFKCNNRLSKKTNRSENLNKNWINFMSESLIKYFIYRIALSLAYLKTLNLVHMDLCPSNILLTKNFNVKIGDFGVSKLLKPGEQLKYDVKPSCSKTFIAPEGFLCKTLSNDDVYKIDIYSMGVIIYKMLTDEFPLGEDIENNIYDEKGNVSQEIISKIKDKLNKENLRYSIKKSRGEISESVINIISELLCFEEKQRIDIYRFLNSNWLNKNLKLIEDIHEKYEIYGEEKINALQKIDRYKIDLHKDENYDIQTNYIYKEEIDPNWNSKIFANLYDELNSGLLIT